MRRIEPWAHPPEPTTESHRIRFGEDAATWAGSIAAVILAFAVGFVVGGVVFNVTQSNVLVGLVWIAIAVGASVLWGARIAALFVIPTGIAAVTGELIGTAPVDPAFYATAGTVSPVLLVALGLEQWSLRQQAKTPFEIVLFIVLLLYAVTSVGATLYGSGACASSSVSCVDLIFSIHLLPNAAFDASAADLAGSGIAGALTALLTLAVIAHREGPET